MSPPTASGEGLVGDPAPDEPRAFVHRDADGRSTSVFVDPGDATGSSGLVGRLLDDPAPEAVTVAGPNPGPALAAAGVDVTAASEATLALPGDRGPRRRALSTVDPEAFDRVVAPAVSERRPVGEVSPERVRAGAAVGPATVAAPGPDGGPLALIAPSGDERVCHHERLSATGPAVARHVRRTGARPPTRTVDAAAGAGAVDPVDRETGAAGLLAALADRSDVETPDAPARMTTVTTPERLDRVHVHEGVPERVVAYETRTTDRPAMLVGRYAGEAASDLPVDDYEWVPSRLDDVTAADLLSAERATGLLLPADDGLTDAAAAFRDGLGDAAADLPVTPVGDDARLHDARVTAVATPGSRDPPAFDFQLGDATVTLVEGGPRAADRVRDRHDQRGVSAAAAVGSAADDLRPVRSTSGGEGRGR